RAAEDSRRDNVTLQAARRVHHRRAQEADRRPERLRLGGRRRTERPDGAQRSQLARRIEAGLTVVHARSSLSVVSFNRRRTSYCEPFYETDSITFRTGEGEMFYVPECLRLN